MQNKIMPQKFKKEYWQNAYNELMESSAQKFIQIENDHEIEYECTECFDTKLCETWDVSKMWFVSEIRTG